MAQHHLMCLYLICGIFQYIQGTINLKTGIVTWLALLSQHSYWHLRKTVRIWQNLWLCWVWQCSLQGPWLPVSLRWNELLTLGTAQSLKLFPVRVKSLDEVKDLGGFCMCCKSALPVFASATRSVLEKHERQPKTKACFQYVIQDSWDASYWNQCLTIMFFFK